MAYRKMTYYRDWDELPVLLTLEQCAVVLNMSYERVRRWAQTGILPATKIESTWRVSKKRLKEFFDQTQSHSMKGESA